MFTETQGHIYVTVLSYFVLLFILFIDCLLFSLSYLFFYLSILPLLFSFLLSFCMSRPFLFAWHITASLVSERNGFSGEALL